MACAAMASPRPTASTPSLVLAFRLMRSASMPSAPASACAHGREMRAEFGPLGNHDGVDMRDAQSLLRRASARTCSRNRKLAASFHCGSLSGKCVPMSPSPAAPSSASQIACASASPSEWPTGPLIEGNFDAAQHELAATRQAVQIVADAGATHARRASRGALLSQIELRQFDVAGPGDLQIALRAEHHMTSCPRRSTSPASSEAVTPSAAARAKASRSSAASKPAASAPAPRVRAESSR